MVRRWWRWCSLMISVLMLYSHSSPLINTLLIVPDWNWTKSWIFIILFLSVQLLENWGVATSAQPQQELCFHEEQTKVSGTFSWLWLSQLLQDNWTKSHSHLLLIILLSSFVYNMFTRSVGVSIHNIDMFPIPNNLFIFTNTSLIYSNWAVQNIVVIATMGSD